MVWNEYIYGGDQEDGTYGFPSWMEKETPKTENNSFGAAILQSKKERKISNFKYEENYFATLYVMFLCGLAYILLKIDIIFKSVRKAKKNPFISKRKVQYGQKDCSGRCLK